LAPIRVNFSGMKSIFVGPKGIRAGWRFLMFLALVIGIAFCSDRLETRVLNVHLNDDWSPKGFLLIESIGGLGIVVTLLAAWIMSRIERKRLADYGLSMAGKPFSLYVEGSLWGMAAVTLLFGLVFAFGGVTLRGLAFAPTTFVKYAIAWWLAMTVLGMSEEFLFRGYPQAALTDGLGFWGAAVVLTLIFGGLHYFGKPMENWIDALSVMLLGLFMAWSLRRTGSLWFAVGFHAAFDFAALAFYGAPNTGNNGKPVNLKLLATNFHGPEWLTGGPRGLEASIFVFVPIALLFILLGRRFRVVRFPAK
jgi:membrane protease YdiL (CAAX protease family)